MKRAASPSSDASSDTSTVSSATDCSRSRPESSIRGPGCPVADCAAIPDPSSVDITGTRNAVSETVHIPLVRIVLLLAPLDGAVHDIQLLACHPQRLHQLRV